MSDEIIDKECTELSNQRGQQEKNTEIISRVEFLKSQTNNNMIKIKLINLYVHCCFDSSKGQFFALNLDTWRKINSSINDLVELYLELREDDSFNSTDEVMVNITNIVQASLISDLEKLEIELYKSLQFTPHDSRVIFCFI